MTTKANKYGLRAAATERTNRHAQRTPLPPRPGVVEGAREVQASLSNGETTDDRSKAKAAAFAAEAVALGWEVGKAIVGGAAEVTATRGAEIMIQAWTNGVWDWNVSFYGFGDRTTKPRNASGAIKLLKRSPEEAGAEAAKVASNRHFRKAEPKDLTERLEDARKALPFDPELASDEEVAGILAGQALKWYNRISRGTEAALVGRGGIRFTFLPNGERVANFCCPVTGYRSCLVTAILRVGRGRALKGTEVAAVEVDA